MPQQEIGQKPLMVEAEHRTRTPVLVRLGCEVDGGRGRRKLSDPVSNVAVMDEWPVALVDEADVLVPDEDPWPPFPDEVDLSAAELLEWAEFLPAGGMLVDVLMSVRTSGLSPGL